MAWGHREEEIRMAITAVITNRDHGQDYRGLIETVDSQGYEFVWNPPRSYDPEDTVAVVKGFDAVIAGGEQYDRYALEQLRDRLKIIIRHGTGIDNIDIDSATEFGIAVTNAPGRNSRPVAEHALGMMISLTRKMFIYDRNVRQGTWDTHFTRELYGKTVGIIGFGAIGLWLARMLSGFDCRIIAYDKVFSAEEAQAIGVEYATIDEMLPQADFVSLHIPLTPETDSSIGMDFFRKMKTSAYFINSSRGKIVREEEMVEALRSGIIAGAGIDVFADTSIDASHPFCSMENVILSPHTSAVTVESMQDAMDCSIENLVDFFSGHRPTNLLNPDYQANRKSDLQVTR
jgi:D-3-phosphoglycerate dehydrogenase